MVLGMTRMVDRVMEGILLRRVGWDVVAKGEMDTGYG